MESYLLIGFFIVLGLVYANILEWLIHKHVLHGLGKSKKSVFSFHWKRHHKASRQCDFYDEDYATVFSWNGNSKEIFGLLFLLVVHFPLYFVAIWLYLTLCYSCANYYYKHRRSHRDPQWAKEHLRWHYDHHMGKNQDVNWGVSRPWADWLFGTRVKYQYDE